MQCTICQQFGHENWSCKNPPKCWICAKDHQTVMHKCNMCNANKTCTHTSAKCTNCHGNHEANSQNCEINKTLKRKFQNICYEQWTFKFSKHWKLKSAQHDYQKFINVMQFFLKYAKSKTMNIVLIQKLWIRNDENNNKFTIFHPNYTCIIPKIKECKSCVATFVSKCKKDLTCIPRIDLINDSDMQILNVIINDIKNVKIINIYNEKNQKSENQTRPIDCLLNINIGENLIANEDFNAHHNWWHSKISNPIKTQKIIKWTKLNKLNSANQHDVITWTRNSSKKNQFQLLI